MILKTDINQKRFIESGNFLNSASESEALAIKRISDRIKKIEKPVFLDVGGCLGAFTMALSNLVEDREGKIYCFEAQRILANCISGSIALNGLKNTYCINKAVGNPNYNDDCKHLIKVPKFNYKKQCNFGSIEFGDKQEERLQQKRQYESERETVELVSLDSYVNEFGKVDIIKMDIEGMELQALNGAINIIKTFHPLVYVEHMKGSKRDLQLFFKKAGYDHYDCFENPRQGELWCEKK
jgi:FkbM family methyltransferase